MDMAYGLWLAEASGGNTGHLASNFYYRPERAPLEAEMTARARYKQAQLFI